MKPSPGEVKEIQLGAELVRAKFIAEYPGDERLVWQLLEDGPHAEYRAGRFIALPEKPATEAIERAAVKMSDLDCGLDPAYCEIANDMQTSETCDRVLECKDALRDVKDGAL